MEVRLPSTLLRQIVGDAFTHENVAGVAAIHHSLRDVDAYAGDVVAPVCILHMMDRAAVDSHPHRQTRLRAQSSANLQGAFDRLFHGTGDNQRYAISCWQNSNRSCSLRFALRYGAVPNLVIFL